MVAELTPGLTKRWTQLNYHPAQCALWHSTARFNVVEAGRRGGKSDLAMRHGTLDPFEPEALELPRFTVVFAGPTRDHAKKIFWKDLKELVPRRAVRRIYESELRIDLITDASLEVEGLDKPERIEGRIIDRFYGDEIAEWKDGIVDQTILPALSTRGRHGRGWFFGVPRPSKQFKKLSEIAKSGDPDWRYHHWQSTDIIDATTLDMLRRSMDPLLFEQEVLASRIALTGRAYYTFERDVHAREPLEYAPTYPLLFAFDFNREPGVAAVGQERPYTGTNKDVAGNGEAVDHWIGEVWIPRSSTTPIVCRRLIEDWKHHKGEVHIDGDATGGAGGSAKVMGSDWDLVKAELRRAFGDRLRWRVPNSNPPERSRVNAVNARFRAADGKIRALVCPKKASHLAEDFELVRVVAGGTGEIDKDKKRYAMFTHLSDGAGYSIERRHPLGGHITVTEQAAA